jgi:uncharacterized membrane protein
VLSIGFLVGFFGLSLLLALLVIAVASGWWRFLLLIVPAAFAVAMGVEFKRSTRKADEQLPT